MDTQILIDCNNLIKDAEFTHNKKALENILSDDLVFHRASGIIESKVSFLSSLDNTVYEFLENSSVETKFNNSENYAISVVLVKAKGINKVKETAFEGTFRNIRFFRKTQKWQLFAWYNEKVI